jgi:ubiquinone/menaquinone biosynthesis C-methylase UbiE
MTMTRGDSPLTSMTPDAIARAVAERYGNVALSPAEKHGFPVGREFAQQVGYPAELLDWAPTSVVDSFTGAGNPRPFIDAPDGAAALDLGCGAGFDALCTAREVGQAGSVVGIDFSQDMIAKAQRGCEESGLDNVRFVRCSASETPFDDDSFDLVTFNGILNLSPDKDAILREVARVLRPGGRVVFAEIVLEHEIEGIARDTLDDWFRCIGGAETTGALLERLSRCGFNNPQALTLERNARTGHEASRSGVFSATVPELIGG